MNVPLFFFFFTSIHHRDNHLPYSCRRQDVLPPPPWVHYAVSVIINAVDSESNAQSSSSVWCFFPNYLPLTPPAKKKIKKNKKPPLKLPK